MADQHQLDVLRQGQDAWNIWRKQHPEIRPDLSSANLRGADLSKANLSFANLSNANLSKANLSDANLSDTNLYHTNLYHTNLCGANLSSANLSSAILSHAILSDAKLSFANLSRADLYHTDLSQADLSQADLNSADLSHTDLNSARAGWTQFDNIDLSTVRGLETVEHIGPSSIGIDTIYCSQGNIPAAFLRKAGVPEDFLTYMRSLVAHPIEYYTCFISYSSHDQEFADRLHADLQSKGVRCWLATEDMKIGDKFRQRIDESIHQHDKLLLILSAHSVASWWVEYEVEQALAKERQAQRTVLFPIRLDEQVMQSITEWAAHLKETRHIGDFTGWKDHDAYQRGLKRLLRDLQPGTPLKESTT